jgi:hypothetical protein
MHFNTVNDTSALPGIALIEAHGSNERQTNPRALTAALPTTLARGGNAAGAGPGGQPVTLHFDSRRMQAKTLLMMGEYLRNG